MSIIQKVKLGHPAKIRAGASPYADVTVQGAEELTEITLHDQPAGKCTKDGALATGLRLLNQFINQIEQKADGLGKLELTQEGVEAWFDVKTPGTIWQSGEDVKRLSGVRCKVANEDALRELLGDDEYARVVDEDGYIQPSELFFVGGEHIEGNPLRGTSDGCEVNGYGYGVLHVRLYNHLDVLLSEVNVALGVGCIDADGKYHGESCPEGAQLKGCLAKLREQTEEVLENVYEVVALLPALTLIPIIAEWPSVVNSLAETGKRNYLYNNTGAYIQTDMVLDTELGKVFKVQYDAILVDSGIPSGWKIYGHDNPDFSLGINTSTKFVCEGLGTGIDASAYVNEHIRYIGDYKNGIAQFIDKNNNVISQVTTTGGKTFTFYGKGYGLFQSVNSNGNPATTNCHSKLSEVKMWLDDVLVRHYVPFVRNGVNGLLDISKGETFNKFHASSNAFTFEIIPNVNK